jgi:antitoxin (DNA-binding transcriptional repressor) of toxin-antitoxin stability system
MRTVDIRELKDCLSESIRAVTAGESVLVTDHGEVVAEISAPGQKSREWGLPPGLESLVRRGLVTPGSGSNDEVGAYKPLPRKRRGTHQAADLLDQERGPE